MALERSLDLPNPDHSRERSPGRGDGRVTQWILDIDAGVPRWAASMQASCTHQARELGKLVTVRAALAGLPSAWHGVWSLCRHRRDVRAPVSPARGSRAPRGYCGHEPVRQRGTHAGCTSKLS
jgi:hypothetical protein